MIEYTYDKVRGRTLDSDENWKEQIALEMFMKKIKTCWVRDTKDYSNETMYELHLTLKEVKEDGR